MDNLILYHGSADIIREPLLEKGKPYNDYGQGFYCTQQREMAKEWAVSEGRDGYMNQYELDMEGLRLLKLSDSDYTVLHWLGLLVRYRRPRLGTPMMRLGADWILQQFSLDLEPYDVVVGYRADDSYFSFARAFLNNEISLEHLRRAMMLGKPGEQVVLKSPTAFSRIWFVGYEKVPSIRYFPLRKERDDSAREAYLQSLEEQSLEGWFLRDLMREGVQRDDPRLQ